MSRFISLTLIAAAVSLVLSCTYAQTATTQAEPPGLQEFFENMVVNYQPSTLPSYEDFRRAKAQVKGADKREISRALPSIFAALAHRDSRVRVYAASALSDITERPDSAELLKSHIQAIASLLNAPQRELQAGASFILSSLRPVPPPEAVAPLLAFVKRTDPDAKAQANAVFALARIAPEQPEVERAIANFLARPLDSGPKIEALNAVGTPRITDPHIIALVAASLDNPDQGVRFTAVQVLTRMGRDAIRQAVPDLERVLARANEAPEVKDAAREALKTIGRTD